MFNKSPQLDDLTDNYSYILLIVVTCTNKKNGFAVILAIANPYPFS